MDSHFLWVYIHILLFVFWLGADVGVYLTMIFVKNAALSFETRATLIKLAFYIDLFPRLAFALFMPVGLQLIESLGLYPVSNGLLALTWVVGLAWSTLHLTLTLRKGTPLAKQLQKINIGVELILGFFFVAVGALSLATGSPLDADWLSLKLMLYGLIFWVILGIDTTFQPFTMILTMGADGSTPEREAAVTRQTDLTLAWAMLLYMLILAIAFMGTVKPI